MKAMPTFRGDFGGGGGEEETLPVQFPDAEKADEDEWDVKINTGSTKPPEKARGSFKNTLARWTGISSIALATLTGEGCKPEDSKEGAAGGGEPTATRVENKSSNFSGYGVSTETKNGELKKSPYGEEKSGQNKFKGYGVER